VINNLAHAANYTEQATMQLPSNTARPSAPADSTTKEDSFADILTLTDKAKAAAETDKAAKTDLPTSSAMMTDKGRMNIDLDRYFSNTPPSTGFFNLNELPPLLMPSAENINALTEHVSTRFKQLLADYDIPSAPEKITFDNAGKMQVPIDYPYANELHGALEENIGMGRELRALNALSSHTAAIQERMPFIEEMGNASSKAETDRIIAKYSHLLSDNNSHKSMALIFSSEGNVSVTADGEPIKFS